MDPSDLTPRQGKCLHFLVSSDRAVESTELVVKSWIPTDLPSNVLQARSTLNWLKDQGLARKSGKQYTATSQGTDLIRRANKARAWNS